MAVASLGSIATAILTRVPDIPTHISGQLVQIVDEERLYMEEYTGLSIGSVGIAEKFQPALTDLAIARALELTQLEGANASSIVLGDFQTSKTGDSNVSVAAGAYKASGEEKLKRLGTTIRFRRVLG